MRDVDIGTQFQQLDCELRNAADARRGVIELAGICFCPGEEIGDAGYARGRPGNDDVGCGAEIGDRREILERIVGDLGYARIDQHNIGDDHQRITIRLGAGTGGNSDIANCANVIFDNDVLPQLRRQLCCQ